MNESLITNHTRYFKNLQTWTTFAVCRIVSDFLMKIYHKTAANQHCGFWSHNTSSLTFEVVNFFKDRGATLKVGGEGGGGH